MNFSFDELKVLITEWEHFKTGGGTDLGNFGQYLQQKLKKTSDSDLVMNAYPSHAPLEPLIGYLWARMLRFSAHLTKKALEETPIRSLEEFGILMVVRERKNPKKGEVVTATLQEATTCFESIKRLMKIGLLEETVDENDKRARRISLSEHGKLTFATIQQKIYMLSQLLVGQAEQKDKEDLIRILKSLDHFHAHLDVQHSNERIEEIIQKHRS